MNAKTFSVAVCVLGLVASCPLAAESSARPHALPATTDDNPTALARHLLDLAGLHNGLAVHVRCGDGRLTAALAAESDLLVQGFEAHPRTVDQARRTVEQQGLAHRVTIAELDGRRLPYAPHMVNLLILAQPDALEREEILRVLVPRGVALTKQPDGRWTRTVKPWPQDIDPWPFWLHGADGNAVSHDRRVGPPRQLQWQARPYWSRHHHTVPSVTDFVSDGGRVFYIVDDAPPGMDGSAPDRWALVARDAFNGLMLWRKPIDAWGWRAWSSDWLCRFTVPTHITRRLVALGDRVYVTLGFNAPLTELDAATGKVLRSFPGSQRTDEILPLGNRLLCALNHEDQKPDPASAQRRGLPPTPPVRKSVALFDISTGRMLWKTGDFVGLRSKTGSMDRISHLSMCASDRRVFFIDRDRLVALDLADGRLCWQSPRPAIPEHRMRYDIRLSDMCTLVYHDGRVFLAQLNPDKRVGWRQVRGRVHAFSADTGKPLWDRPCAGWGWAHPPDLFIVNDLVWVHDYEQPYVLALDPATGQVRRKISNFKAFDNGHHHRCYRNKATSRFLMTSYRGLEFIDWTDGRTDLNHWVRGTCRLGAFPCNGLIYATPHPCSCYISSKLNGFVALAPADPQPSIPPAHPLQTGPAFNWSAPPGPHVQPVGPTDWPTFRHDPQRTGSAGQPLSADLRRDWQVHVGPSPTAPSVAGTHLLAASGCRLVALDVRTGRLKWTFTAPARIDSPPTIDAGRALFGCADGWLYCLKLDDGQLVWRFRGAPRPRWIGDRQSVASAWPIHGSPIVQGHKVYFTAGRSSYLDGGIYAFVLDIGTGQVIDRRLIASDPDQPVDAGTDRSIDSGLLSDLLVLNGSAVYMRQRRLWPAEPPPPTTILQLPADLLHTTSGMLNNQWFSRTRWYLGPLPLAEYMVFDDSTLYGVRARPAMSGYSGFIRPGQGYELLAIDRAALSKLDPKKVQAVARREEKPLGLTKRWSVRLPVRVTAMVLAGPTLFAAGWPDRLEEGDQPWAAYDGRGGGVLLALSADSGQVLHQYDLPAPTVADGLAVAGGRLFACTSDGAITCLSPP